MRAFDTLSCTESEDSDADDSEFLGSQKSNETIDIFAKEFLFTPQASIYRHMAIGVYGGARHSKLFGIALVVLLLQSLGTMCLFGMHRRELRSHRHILLWTHLEDLWNKAEAGDDTSFVTWAWYNEEVTVLVQKKLLGTLLMFLVYQHIDRVLLDQDVELYNLRRFFRHIRDRWLIWEAVCNGLCGAIIGMCLGEIIEGQETVLDVIVDSMGMVFLLNLDDMASGFNYATSETVFADLIDKKRIAWAKQHAGLKADDKTFSFDKLSLLLSFFRALNLLLFCVNVPFYATTHMAESKGVDAHIDKSFFPLYAVLRDTVGCWILWSAAMLMALLIFNVWTFLMVDGSSQQSLDEQQIQRKDTGGFFSLVILRRPDPRWSERCSLEVALSLSSEGAL